MGELKRITEDFDQRRGQNAEVHLSEDDLRRRMEVLERDIRESWESHKRHHRIMHGVEIQDNGLRMVLLWLLRRGIL